jgi:hypothetical protein
MSDVGLEVLRPHFDYWCVWGAGSPDSSLHKAPISPNGGAARSNDVTTFSTFDAATLAKLEGKYRGVGVLMREGTALTCIEVDKCIDLNTGGISAAAERVLSIFKGYTEVSQSGTGLHLFFRNRRRNDVRVKVTHEGNSIELYQPGAGRYIAVTGNVFRGRDQILDEDEALDTFIREFGFLKTDAGTEGGGSAQQPVPRPTSTPDTATVTDNALDDAEILQRILWERTKRGAKRIDWQAVMNGDDTQHGGDTSGADFALLGKIAYYAADVDQVISTFELTSRGKREKLHRRNSSLPGSAAKVFAQCGGHYFKPRAEARALSVAEERYAGRLEGGLAGLSVTRRGTLQSNIHNAIEVLSRDRQTAGLFRRNGFLQCVEATHAPSEVFGLFASSKAGEFSEADEVAVRKFLIAHYGLNLSKADMCDAIGAVAKMHSFNQLQDALRVAGEQWDGKPRLRNWLVDYLGADASECPEYVAEVGYRFLISAVARAMQPGCKADNMLVLCGAQGAGKSQTARALAEAIYADSFKENIPVVGERNETARALKGGWLIELAELSAIKGRDAQSVKAFISTQVDEARDPYERRFTSRPRQCVFIGTTNEDEWLTDDTGGRRFWPIKVGKINIYALREDARQLWGEAVTAYLDGEIWHLAEGVALQQALSTQKGLAITSALDDVLEDLVRDVAAAKGGEISLRQPMFYFYKLAFPKAEEEYFASDKVKQMQFASALKRAGFEKVSTTAGKRWQLSAKRRTELDEEAREAMEAAGSVAMVVVPERKAA